MRANEPEPNPDPIPDPKALEYGAKNWDIIKANSQTYTALFSQGQKKRKRLKAVLDEQGTFVTMAQYCIELFTP